MPGTATPNRPDDAASSVSGPQQRRRAGLGAIGILRVLLAGTIVLPLLLGGIGSYLSYRAWPASPAVYAAIGVAAAIGFILLSLVALRRIEREHAAQDASETQRRHADDRVAELSAANEELKQTIGALQAAKAATEAASKAKSEFLANMSHELRTPLNAIIGFSDLMRSEMLGPISNPKYRDYASDIHFSGMHLLDIINGILDVVRFEAGKLELHEDAVAVEKVVDEALRLVSPLASRGEVELRWEPPVPALPPLYCDQVRLRQILLNILSNAVKFTGPGGTVETTAGLDDGLHIVIRDTGIGISSEDIGRIMMPFGQVASAYSRNHEGAGLGLTLTKALVEQHGGRLDLDSAPGIGTTVRLSFPAERVLREPSGIAIGSAASS